MELAYSLLSFRAWGSPNQLSGGQRGLKFLLFAWTNFQSMAGGNC